jgi:hypothetical protein
MSHQSVCGISRIVDCEQMAGVVTFSGKESATAGLIDNVSDHFLERPMGNFVQDLNLLHLLRTLQRE